MSQFLGVLLEKELHTATIAFFLANTILLFDEATAECAQQGHRENLKRRTQNKIASQSRRINIYIYIVQSTDTCFAVPQLISVAWYNVKSGYGMAIIYTQAIVSDNRLWDNSCHAHIQRA